MAGIGIGAAQFSALAFVPLFVQGALGASATDAGLALVPGTPMVMRRSFAIS